MPEPSPIIPLAYAATAVSPLRPVIRAISILAIVYGLAFCIVDVIRITDFQFAGVVRLIAFIGAAIHIAFVVGGVLCLAFFPIGRGALVATAWLNALYALVFTVIETITNFPNGFLHNYPRILIYIAIWGIICSPLPLLIILLFHCRAFREAFTSA